MLRKSLELSIKDFYCVFVRTEINLIAFSGPRNCINTQYAALSGAMDTVLQCSHSQGKVREKFEKIQGQGKVREFEFSQGNLKFWQKSGKSQGILESEVEGGEIGLIRGINEKMKK